MNTYRRLRTLLAVHGFITLAAGIVLTLAPALIPSLVGVPLDPKSYIIAYLLAGAEFGFATISFVGSRLTDPHGLRTIVWSCVVFHGSTALLELYAFSKGVSAAILANVALRLIIIVLFVYFSNDRALRKPPYQGI